MNTCKALYIQEFNRPPRLLTLTLPDPDEHEVQIEIAFCGLNHADLLMRQGTYQETPPLPFVPGLEISGTVIAVGAAVQDITIGDHVAGYCGQGGLAERVNTPAAWVCKIPHGLRAETAAAVPITYGTASLSLHGLAQLEQGERLAVSGAAGATGLAAIEIGAACGAEIIAIARGDHRLSVCQSRGAHHLIDPDKTDLNAAIRALGKSHVVFDTVGGGIGDTLFRSTNASARLLLIGFASGQPPEIKANHALVKNLSIFGVNWPAYRFLNPARFRRSIQTSLELAASGRISPVISEIYSLNEVEKALDAMRARSGSGKILIKP